MRVNALLQNRVAELTQFSWIQTLQLALTSIDKVLLVSFALLSMYGTNKRVYVTASLLLPGYSKSLVRSVILRPSPAD